MTDLDQYVSQHAGRMHNQLVEWLRIPSVSSLPAHDGDCRRAADWAAAHLGQLGCPTVALLEDQAHPVVWAQGPRAPGRPTVLVYGHYDVQPPDPLAEWTSPPFEPTVRGGNLYARGATDDKGQVFAILKAFECAARDRTPPLNVHFLLEGQEESGSAAVLSLIARRPKVLHADVVLVADSAYFAPGWPAIEVGVRGVCYVEVILRTLRADLHSGLYGGAVPNAHECLARILARLKTPAGRIRIPGLYGAVRRPSRRERDGWKRLPFSEAAFRREAGSAALLGNPRATVLERLWALPSLDLHGVTGGFTGEGVKTVIPAEARAKLSLRLVPDQRVETVLRQLRRAVRAATPRYARVQVRLLTGAEPVLVATDHPAFGHIDRAFREVEHRGVVQTRSGGSLPIMQALGARGAPVVLAGVGLPDDRPHAPNEKLSLRQFATGVRVFTRFLEAMARDRGPGGAA